LGQFRAKQTLEKDIKDLEREKEASIAFLQTSDQRLRTNRAKASTFLYQVHSQFPNSYCTEMCSGSETGSYVRRIACMYHSALGLRVIKKKRRPGPLLPTCVGDESAGSWSPYPPRAQEGTT